MVEGEWPTLEGWIYIQVRELQIKEMDCRYAPLYMEEDHSRPMIEGAD